MNQYVRNMFFEKILFFILFIINSILLFFRFINKVNTLIKINIVVNKQQNFFIHNSYFK